MIATINTINIYRYFFVNFTGELANVEIKNNFIDRIFKTSFRFLYTAVVDQKVQT